MRGKQGTRDDGTTGHKDHPACAGKTLRRAARTRGEQDHPRVCGENFITTSSIGSKRGSPPRVWGKPLLPLTLYSVLRITPACAGKTFLRGPREAPAVDHPACAGKTSTRCRRLSTRPDHPRVCGENGSISLKAVTSSGSPPRVRGKPAHILRAPVDARITPAHAGKTLCNIYMYTHV